MARDECGPFTRGETYYNGGDIDANNLGGTALEGRVFVLEPNAPNGQDSADPSGRAVTVKIVRNVSGVNLKPGRLVHYSPTVTTNPYETRIDGYCKLVADRPAGIVDEFLPAAGVPNNDLFYMVIKGPTKVKQAASNTSVAVGDRLVAAATGSTITDDLAGRVTKQDISGATATLANQIQNKIGLAAEANAVNDALFAATVDF